MSRTFLPLVILVSLGSACINPEKKDDDNDQTDQTTIFDIQQGLVEEDTVVSLNNVLVSTPMTLEGDGFFIQDPAGGEYSGIYVYLQGSFSDLFLSVGDQISLSGTYTEYYELSELTVTSETAISITGYNDLPTTPVSDVTDWEPYEGVVVQLADQEVQDCTNQYGEVGLSEGIQMDDAFFPFDASKGDTFETVSGAITYSYGEFKLWPRSEEDLSGKTDGPGCTSTIAEIQSEGIEGGVELEGVVVTSGMTYDGEGFFIQDMGGGEYSGIYVYTAYLDEGAIDPQVGDVIDISGSVTEYYDFTELILDNPDNMVVTGSAEPVASLLTEAPADWEPYEGNLVTVADLNVTSNDNGYGDFDTNYDILLSNLFFTADATNGTIYEEATGLVAYSYGEFHLGPRDNADLSGETTGDPTDPEPGESVSISEIQMGDVSEGANVTITDVVVTSPSDGSGFFVQDPDGGTYSGIYVYGTSMVVSVGDQMTVTGEVVEYYDFTEIVVGSDSDISITGTGTVSVTTLSGPPSDWEAYEGMLIQFDAISLASDPDEYGQSQTSWSDLTIDDKFYTYMDDFSNGDAFSSITGLLAYSYSAWRIYPRNMDDFAW